MSRNPNPQGKGQVPVLAALSASQAAAASVPPKHIDQISTELFTSLFVLESDFQFQPVPQRPYWLYEKEGRFRLSLTPPDFWDEPVSGRYIGECQLQEDMTWTLLLSDAAARDDAFIRFLEEKRDRFQEELESAESVDDVLPAYREHLPFYRRAFAYGLGRSLGMSMEKSGIQGLSYSEARGLLGHDGDSPEPS